MEGRDIHTMISYGLSSLLESEDGTVDSEDIDILLNRATKIEESTNAEKIDISEEKSETSKDEEMYVFEGVDYSKESLKQDDFKLKEVFKQVLHFVIRDSRNWKRRLKLGK